ncbi:unnamed protein product [marine sediment metagenome]|uniref:DUF2442 domain-containing protein n=1 Tax=marine sediment metagenome TaxID=412755 RepID=X1KR68_9ZZZZ
MSTSVVKSVTALAKRVWFDETKMFVQLTDGREIAVPLEWFPGLRGASKKQKNNWRLIGGGVGIHWKDIDEDISIEGLLKQ